jgi:hypothetical protein
MAAGPARVESGVVSPILAHPRIAPARADRTIPRGLYEKLTVLRHRVALLKETVGHSVKTPWLFQIRNELFQIRNELFRIRNELSKSVMSFPNP